MLSHFLHLALRSWLAMVSATSTNTLGFFVWSVLVAVLAWLIAVLNAWLNIRKEQRGWQGLAVAFRSNLKAGSISVGVVFIVAIAMWAVFCVRTVYADHTQFVALHAEDTKRIADEETQVKFYQHNISTHDPVFSNLIYLLQDFAVFRNNVHGETCVVRITAPEQSQPLASAFAQFSVNTSNCPTFGPDELFDRNPDLKGETLNGMVPDAIVFHAARDDRAANELFSRLSNQVKLVRSYNLPSVHDYQTPAGGYAHTVWLQFGSQVKWNSELYR